MDLDKGVTGMAERIRALREICGFSEEEVAESSGVAIEEYRAIESGESDFGFTFLYRCAEKLGVDIVDIITGDSPRLSGFSVVRSGEGLPISRREGFTYLHLAPAFKDKIAEPFLVTAPFREEEQDRDIVLSRHEGQELDYIISGTLRFSHEGRIVDVGPGDTLYYDSGRGHGMIATSPEGCVFLAVVMRRSGEE